MRKLAFLFVAFALVAVSFYGCNETAPTEPSGTLVQSATTPSLKMEMKPISPESYISVYNSANVPHGWRAYVTVECPSGTFPFGGYHAVNDVTGARLPSYDGIDIINTGVAHDYAGDGSMDYTVGVEDNRASGAPQAQLWVRAYCAKAGFFAGKQGIE